MTAIGLVNTIKKLAGVVNTLAVIEAEGRVADRPADNVSKEKEPKADIYKDLENE